MMDKIHCCPFERWEIKFRYTDSLTTKMQQKVVFLWETLPLTPQLERLTYVPGSSAKESQQNFHYMSFGAFQLCIKHKQ